MKCMSLKMLATGYASSACFNITSFSGTHLIEMLPSHFASLLSQGLKLSKMNTLSLCHFFSMLSETSLVFIFRQVCVGF